MSLATVGAVLEQSRSKGNARLVLLLLADQAAGPVVRLDVEDMTVKANMTEAEVHRQVTRLCEMGEMDSLGDGTYRLVLRGLNES